MPGDVDEQDEQSMPPSIGSPAQPMNLAEAPSRQGERCYSRSDPSALGEFEIVLGRLSPESFDGNGCLLGSYAGWVEPGASCTWDSGAAVVRGDQCCYVLNAYNEGCGRPLMIEGQSRVASLRAELGGLKHDAREDVVVLDREVAEQAGREWLDDALLEHSSVASFACFALSLMAVGAPAELIEQCQRAGLDEIEHARSCFSLAERFSGQPRGPGPLDLSGLAVPTELAEVAVRTLLDGCIEETIAALTAAAQLEVAVDARAKATLERIAEDEARHAELAWRFVAWAAAEGGPRVARALQSAGEAALRSPALPAAPPELRPKRLAQLHAAGRLSVHERAMVRANALNAVIRPALAELCSKQPPRQRANRTARAG